MKVILQKDLYERSARIFDEASEKYGIELLIAGILDEDVMLAYHKQGALCFVIGAERYSAGFYQTISEGSAIIRYGVGYNAVPVDICLRRNIKVGYTPGTLTDSVAEHTFALLLAVARKIPELHQSVTAGYWKGIIGVELKNKTMAIIGYGQIGQTVAKIAKYGFGMKVFAFDNRDIPADSLYDFHSSDFGDVVKNADVVSIHLSSLPDTVGFVDEKKIGMMKDGIILINTARGELIVEKDLFKALKSGKILAAGLDVFGKEPYVPEEDADFRKLANVILTPHCGSNTKEASERMAKLVVKNIVAYYSSKPMILIPEMNGL